MKDPASINVDEERAMHWLKVGATASDTARSILRKSGVWEKFEAGKKQAE
jgi:small subunit ribosomal protein S16